jgi:metal-dependent amidase/aminoacylase/carboxypeptidase family protein
MANTQALPFDPALHNLGSLIPELEALYKDVHSHPELSMQESRTAALAADRLRAAGYEVTTGVGKTGVVGLLRNGGGPTVMLRADMDALPIQEATGLAYASKATRTDREGKTVPVSHMCGHDMHVTWLAGAAKLIGEARTSWRGTLMAVFQPAEETGEGARAMIDDGLFKRFPTPDIILGQHVMGGPSGTVAGRSGAITSAADSLQIRLFGRGAHGSMTQASIDPVVMAASTVLRLQTIVSREVAAAEAAVLTVGVLQGRNQGKRHSGRGHHQAECPYLRCRCAEARAGCDRADRQGRSCRFGGASAAGNHDDRPIPPQREQSGCHEAVVDAFREHFGTGRVRATGPAPASEDFGSFGSEWHVPSVFWFVGGTDPETYAKEGGESDQRASCEPQSEIRARSPSYIANRCRSARRRRPRLVADVATSLIQGSPQHGHASDSA